MKARLLALLRVPERPDPPPGAGETLETFRAAPGFFYYSVLTWIPKQVAAFAGLMFSLAFFGSFDNGGLDFVQAEGWDRWSERLGGVEFSLGSLEMGLGDIFIFFELLAIATWLGQLVFTGVSLKLSWEQRWYLVGERALRIRHGLWSVREQTMTIANIQNMIVRQGPVQRIFGISDLEIYTAGGGSGSQAGEDPTQQKDSFHVGRFRGVKNASTLRDTIRARLQEVKAEEAGGESARGGRSQSLSQDRPRTDAHAATAGARETDAETRQGRPNDLESAALALLGEARALRRSLART